MLRRSEKADYSRPGMKWTVDPKSGDLIGKIYSTWVTRLKRRGRTAAILAVFFAIFIADVILHIEPDEKYLDELFGIYIISFIGQYALTIIWPFWPNSRKIRMSKEFFTVGGKRHHMDDIGHFSHETVYKGQSPYYYVSFLYGNRRKKIKVMNNVQHTADIAVFLSNIRQEILEYQEPECVEEGADEVKADPRSASF